MSFFGTLGKIAGVVAAPFTGGASLVPSVISAGADILGGVMSNNSAKQLASSNNAAAIELANTAHQRETKDLLAAGLNPILSANGGASVPSLQTAPVENVLKNSVSSALVARNSYLQNDALKAQIEQTKASIEQTNASADAAKAQAEKTASEKAVIDKNLADIMRYGAGTGSSMGQSMIGAFRRGSEVAPEFLSDLLERAASGQVGSSARSLVDRVRELYDKAVGPASSAKGAVRPPPRVFAPSLTKKEQKALSDGLFERINP